MVNVSTVNIPYMAPMGLVYQGTFPAVSSINVQSPPGPGDLFFTCKLQEMGKMFMLKLPIVPCSRGWSSIPD